MKFICINSLTFLTLNCSCIKVFFKQILEEGEHNTLVKKGMDIGIYPELHLVHFVSAKESGAYHTKQCKALL